MIDQEKADITGEKELVIWKYTIPIQDEFTIEMPEVCDFLHVDVQDDLPRMWMMVDPNSPKKFFHFRLVGTGHPVKVFQPFGGIAHLGTVLLHDGKLVYHLFAK